MAPVLVTVSPSWISLRLWEGLPVVSEDDDTDVVSLEVEGHTPDSGPEFHHLSGLDLVEADHSGDTVTDADDSAELVDSVLRGGKGTTWVMFRIFSWITLAVSAIPSFLEVKLFVKSRNNPLMC